ncbi:hypothetical protein GGR77_002017 [Xanthomonas translucens]
MGLLLILPLLVSGFIVCLKDRIVFSRLHRYEGQLLYLLVAYHGLICFVVALFFVSFLSIVFSHEWAGGCIGLWERHLCLGAFNTDFLAWGGSKLLLLDNTIGLKGQVYSFFILIGVFTCLAPFILAPIRHGFYKWRLEAIDGKSLTDEQFHAFLNIKAVEHLPIADALANSLSSRSSVMITMADRKVYVGVVQSIGGVTEVNGALENFGILLSHSGYRDKDTLKVHYTYKYSVPENERVPIFFAQANVASVTRYDAALAKKIEELPAKGKSSFKKEGFFKIAGGVAGAVILGHVLSLRKRR